MKYDKYLIVLNILASIACISLALKYIVVPYAATNFYKEKYKELVFACDNVMRDHLIAKNRVVNEKSEKSIKQLKAAELGLLTCDDYDKLRKKMIVLGVSEGRLSMYGLEAIEEKAEDVRTFVRTHEFKY
jgi:hypothetical protein